MSKKINENLFILYLNKNCVRKEVEEKYFYFEIFLNSNFCYHDKLSNGQFD